MADKKFPLSIVLQTVDNATAGIQRLQGRLDKLAVNQIGAKLSGKGSLGEVLGKLGESAGVGRVLGGFARVGNEIGALASKFAFLGVAAAGAGVAAVGALKSIIGEFDDLGDKAERVGVSADFLAGLGSAAKLSGASLEALNSGLDSFNVNIGGLKAGKGRLFSFLEGSPLLQQLKGAKGPEEAIGLVANAMAKLTDPAKKAKLAQAAFGGSGAELVPLLARGSKGIAELIAQFAKTAGPLSKAVEIAGKVADTFDILTGAIQGVKASIVIGLGPVIGQLTTRLTAFLTENRDRIGQWLVEFGAKIPAAVEKTGAALRSIFDIISKVSDSIGGLTGAATILAALFTGKLIVSIGLLSVALVTTPFGWLIATLALVAGGLSIVALKWDEWGDSISSVTDKLSGIADFVSLFTPTGFNTKAAKELKEGSELGGRPLRSLNAAAALPGGPGVGREKLRIDVNFANLPRGTRVDTSPSATIDVDTDVGYQMFP